MKTRLGGVTNKIGDEHKEHENNAILFLDVQHGGERLCWQQRMRRRWRVGVWKNEKNTPGDANREISKRTEENGTRLA